MTDIGTPPVLDGRTGRFIEVDGEPAALVDTPPAPVLIEQSIQELIASLMRCDDELADLEERRKTLTEAIKDTRKVRESLIEQIKDGSLGAMVLPFAGYDDTPDADDEDAP